MAAQPETRWVGAAGAGGYDLRSKSPSIEGSESSVTISFWH